jgi:hypothetical protein
MRSLLKTLLLMSLFAMPVTGFAQSDPLRANVYVGHAINGEDLGLGLPESLPVDIVVNGGCFAQGIEFRTFAGPIELDAGAYDIEVRVDNGTDCMGPLAVAGTINISVAENATILAYLNEPGSPSLTKFTNDVRSSNGDDARLTVRHTASAQPVIVQLDKSSDRRWYRKVPVANWRIDNPDERTADLPAMTYSARISDNTAGFFFGRTLVGPAPITLDANSAKIIYAVGSIKNGTFELLEQNLPID